ncbi:MAG TPA: zinc-ribbon domain-containing protein [Anaerolineales bacterium]|nr:zinc-ribbon domain-containing protein [Anaerolineales bacterium]
MYCPNCGKEIADEAVVCVGCGRPVTPLKVAGIGLPGTVGGAGAGAKALHDTARSFLFDGILSIILGIVSTSVGWFFGIFTVIAGIIELVHAYQYWPTPPRKKTNATFVPVLEIIAAIGGSLWSVFIGAANLKRLRSADVKAYFQALQSGQPMDLTSVPAGVSSMSSPAAAGVKKCPSCGNSIPLEAKICQFCRHDFSDEDIQAARKQYEVNLAQSQAAAALASKTKRGKSLRVIGGIIAGLGVLVLLLFILVTVTSPKSSDTTGMLDASLFCPLPLILLGAGLYYWGYATLRKLKAESGTSQPSQTGGY